MKQVPERKKSSVRGRIRDAEPTATQRFVSRHRPVCVTGTGQGAWTQVRRETGVFQVRHGPLSWVTELGLDPSDKGKLSKA